MNCGSPLRDKIKIKGSRNFQKKEIETEKFSDDGGNAALGGFLHLVYFKMAARKGKIPGKRDNLQIKSKINTGKRVAKLMKKNKAGEKPLENLKWLRPRSETSVVNQNKTGSNWFEGRVCKHRRGSSGSVPRSVDYLVSMRKDARTKSSTTDSSEASENSDECHCLYPKYKENNKTGILKRKISSTDSVVAKYIKSGMDHVASFIVESAIRFGEQHGVVVADKNMPNVYEIIAPDTRYGNKTRKIRFKLNKQAQPKGNRKWRKESSELRIVNRTQDDVLITSDVESRPSEICCSKSSSWSSKTDSLEDILPLLEKLQNDEEIVTSELDLNVIKREMREECPPPRERLRDRHKVFDKRYKNVAAESKPSEEENYTKSKYPWRKRLRRETLNMPRLRPRASTCPRKENSFSPL